MERWGIRKGLKNMKRGIYPDRTFKATLARRAMRLKEINLLFRKEAFLENVLIYPTARRLNFCRMLKSRNVDINLSLFKKCALNKTSKHGWIMSLSIRMGRTHLMYFQHKSVKCALFTSAVRIIRKLKFLLICLRLRLSFWILRKILAHAQTLWWKHTTLQIMNL